MENVRSSMFRNVSEIEATGRQWLERVFGRQLDDGEQVYIMAFTPENEPADSIRRNAAARLQQLFEKVDAYAKERGITAAEFDAAVDEAMEHVRHRNY